MRLVISLALGLLLGVSATAAQTGETPVVRAVFFWMRTCPHCHEVITNVLPPLQEKYGAQLDILFIEIETRQDFERLYAIGREFGIPRGDIGVPFLVIGDQVLIGSLQIPAELPHLIEKYLAAGGVDFPRVPALADILPAPKPPEPQESSPEPQQNEEMATAELVEPSVPEQEPPAQEEQPSLTPPDVQVPELSETLSLKEGFSRGFELAIAVLIGMILAVIYVFIQIIRVMQGAPVRSSSRWRDGALIVLSVLGMAIAAYLAYVETQAVAAFCGPVGDCNTVQSSPYAKLFGVLPVGVLGVIGYIAILVVWFWGRWGSGKFSAYAPLFVLAMTLFGVLFSIYLTYLEPFVIGAVCMWCVSSAIIMTLLMLLSLRPALRVVREYSDAAQGISRN